MATEISEMSGVSSLDQSEASGIEGAAALEGGGRNWGIVVGMVCAVIVLGVVFAYALAYFDFGGEYTDTEDGRGSNTTKNDMVIPTGRPRTMRRKMATRGPQDREESQGPEETPEPQVTQGEEEPKAPAYTELVCTVGAAAVLESMYPDDGLCGYLYYTEIIVDTAIRTGWQDEGWRQFQAQMSSMRKTGGGIAFDINYVTPEGLRQAAVLGELKRLANRNVAHYGLLNVISNVGGLPPLLNKAGKLLEEMKIIQQNSPNAKTILAIGLYDYGPEGAWDTYRNQFVRAVNEFKADTVITITSSGFMESEDKCVAVPPSATTSDKPGYPSLERHGELVKKSFSYDRADAVVGLSYQLAVLTYQLEKGTDDPEKIAYQKCISASHGDQEILCADQDRHKDLPFGRAGFIVAGDNRHVFLGDNQQSATAKASYVKNLGLRNRFAWLLYNVHLTTVRDNLCVERFAVLKAIRESLELDAK